MVDNTIQFYTPDKQCPVCYESHGRFPMFPVQFSFNNNTKQFMLTTCGHPCCKNCVEKLVTVTPDGDYVGKSCPVCRYTAQYFISVDIEKSLIEDFTKDNYAMQCEVRQLAAYASTIRKDIVEYKWSHITQKLISSTKNIFKEANEEYITDDETFLDMETDEESSTEMEERPITSRYHQRRLQQLRIPTTPTTATDSVASTTTPSEIETPPTDINDTVRDALMVIFKRLGKIHERLSDVETEQTVSKLAELRRQYQLKKYETILLEKEILDMKQDYMRTRTQFQNDQANDD